MTAAPPFNPGDVVVIKATGSRARVLAVSGQYALVRTRFDAQWTYAHADLEALPPEVCPI